MGDLISRSALISKLTEKAKKQTEFIAELAFFESAKMAQEMPTAEAESVRYGEWVFDSFTAKYARPYRCSRCHEEHADSYNFCHNCGADMRGKSKV